MNRQEAVLLLNPRSRPPSHAEICSSHINLRPSIMLNPAGSQSKQKFAQKQMTISNSVMSKNI